MRAIDHTNFYRNFKDFEWKDRYFQRKIECVPMVELSTRISNMSYNHVMLFDFAFNESSTYKYKKRDNPNY